MKTYTCSACGAKILLNDQLSHVSTCLYCGNTIVVSNEEINNLNIQKMIPFTIEKEEAIRKIKRVTKDKVVEAKKVYVPVKFSNYHYDYLKYFQYRVEHEDEHGNSSYSYHDTEILLDGDAEREIIFGTSKVSDIKMDYEYRKQPVIDYNPSLVQDVSIEISDFSKIDLPKQQEKRLKDYALRYFASWDITTIYSENYCISDSKIDAYTTLVPVYVIKTERNVVYNIPGIKTPNPPIKINFFLAFIIAFISFILISILMAYEQSIIPPLFLVSIVFIGYSITRSKNNHTFEGFSTHATRFSPKRKKLK